MLQEAEAVRQVLGEPKRRWFSDDYFDLIVWVSDSNDILSFQLCYDKTGDLRALNWQEKGYSHLGVDDGEGRFGKPKATPVLVPDGVFNKDGVVKAFEQACSNMDAKVAKFVIEKIKDY